MCHPACVMICSQPAGCKHLSDCGHAVVCCLLSSEGSLEIGCKRKRRNKFKTLVSGTSPQIGPANPCLFVHKYAHRYVYSNDLGCAKSLCACMCVCCSALKHSSVRSASSLFEQFEVS